MKKVAVEIFGGCLWDVLKKVYRGINHIYNIYLGLSPLPVRVTTRIITFLVGNPYKPSFPLLLGRGDNPIYIYIYILIYVLHRYIYCLGTYEDIGSSQVGWEDEWIKTSILSWKWWNILLVPYKLT